MVPTGIGLQAVNTATFSPERKTNVRDETLDAVDEFAQTWMNNVCVRSPPCPSVSSSTLWSRERFVRAVAGARRRKLGAGSPAGAIALCSAVADPLRLTSDCVRRCAEEGSVELLRMKAVCVVAVCRSG